MYCRLQRPARENMRQQGRARGNKGLQETTEVSTYIHIYIVVSLCTTTLCSCMYCGLQRPARGNRGPHVHTHLLRTTEACRRQQRSLLQRPARGNKGPYIAVVVVTRIHLLRRVPALQVLQVCTQGFSEPLQGPRIRLEQDRDRKGHAPRWCPRRHMEAAPSTRWLGLSKA